MDRKVPRLLWDPSSLALPRSDLKPQTGSRSAVWCLNRCGNALGSQRMSNRSGASGSHRLSLCIVAWFPCLLSAAFWLQKRLYHSLKHMPIDAETHAVLSGKIMPPLAEYACSRSGICTDISITIQHQRIAITVCDLQYYMRIGRIYKRFNPTSGQKQHYLVDTMIPRRIKIEYKYSSAPGAFSSLGEVTHPFPFIRFSADFIALSTVDREIFVSVPAISILSP